MTDLEMIVLNEIVALLKEVLKRLLQMKLLKLLLTHQKTSTL